MTRTPDQPHIPIDEAMVTRMVLSGEILGFKDLIKTDWGLFRKIRSKTDELKTLRGVQNTPQYPNILACDDMLNNLINDMPTDPGIK